MLFRSVLGAASGPCRPVPPPPRGQAGQARLPCRSRSTNLHALVARPASRNPTCSGVPIPDVGGDEIVSCLEHSAAAGTWAGQQFQKFVSSSSMCCVVAACGGGRPAEVVLALVAGLAGSASRGRRQSSAGKARPVHRSERRKRRSSITSPGRLTTQRGAGFERIDWPTHRILTWSSSTSISSTSSESPLRSNVRSPGRSSLTGTRRATLEEVW